jgi:hypothetical protein
VRCPDCGEDKPLGQFPRNRSTNTGRAAYCKLCHAARTKRNIKRRYGGGRNFQLKRRYGLDDSGVAALVASQGLFCPLCLRRPPEHVDHDHASGRVRGILCFKCNGALGKFEEDVDVLVNALAYLENENG